MALYSAAICTNQHTETHTHTLLLCNTFPQWLDSLYRLEALWDAKPTASKQPDRFAII